MVHITHANHSMALTPSPPLACRSRWQPPTGIGMRSRHTHPRIGALERKMEGRIVMDHILTLLFWSGAAVVVYSCIAASVRYLYHLRRGAKIMAAQAMLQSMLSMFGLVALFFVHRYYLPG